MSLRALSPKHTKEDTTMAKQGSSSPTPCTVHLRNDTGLQQPVACSRSGTHIKRRLETQCRQTRMAGVQHDTLKQAWQDSAPPG